MDGISRETFEQMDTDSKRNYRNKMGSSLDRYHEYLLAIRDRVLCMGEKVEILEICRDDLSNIGRGILTCLLDDRSDIIPSGSWMIFNSNDCLALGRRVLEKLFRMQVGINSANLGLRGHVRVTYASGHQELFKLG
jgi:hypothetical protein